MQSYYQYVNALVSARSVILSSESHNSVNFPGGGGGEGELPYEEYMGVCHG